MLMIRAKPAKITAAKRANGLMEMVAVSIVAISAEEIIVARVTLKAPKVMAAGQVKMVKMADNVVDAIIHASDAIDRATMPVAAIR